MDQLISAQVLRRRDGFSWTKILVATAIAIVALLALLLFCGLIG